MNILRHRYNQIKFYIGKYGFVKTVKKCIKTVIRRIIRFIKNEKDLQYGDYGGWIKFNEPKDADLKKQMSVKFELEPKISVVVPMYNTKEKFFKELIKCMMDQTYSNWELCLADGSPKPNENFKKYYEQDERINYKFLNGNLGIAGNSNAAIEMATGDYIALLDHDDVLADYALYEIVYNLNKFPNAEFLYSDEDKIDENGNRYDAYFKPDFAPDTLRCQNYICHFSVFKKELLEKLGGFRENYDGAQDYDIFLRMSEITNPKNISHVPKILYHWRVHNESTAKLNSNAKNYAFEAGKKAIEDHLKRIGLDGEVSEGCIDGIYRIDYKVIGEPKVSIVIPNKDGKDILEVCINSILEKTTYKNYEIVISENNSETEEIYEYYKTLLNNEKIKIANYNTGKLITKEEECSLEFTNKNRRKVKPGFNYSAVINYGVHNTTGEYIIQLNNDTELITENWLELMLGFCQRKDVGAVGVKLYFPDETIQHAGIIVGIGGIAGNRFKSIPKSGHGYFAKESMIENLSAVTAACMMTPKSIYEEVGWMDENLAVAFNDVDFCLKIREKGYLIVYNPFVEFWHYESKTRGQEDSPAKIKRFQGEMSRFEQRWPEILDSGDPYYNINLSLDTEVYHMKNIKVNYYGEEEIIKKKKKKNI